MKAVTSNAHRSCSYVVQGILIERLHTCHPSAVPIEQPDATYALPRGSKALQSSFHSQAGIHHEASALHLLERHPRRSSLRLRRPARNALAGGRRRRAAGFYYIADGDEDMDGTHRWGWPGKRRGKRTRHAALRAHPAG